MADDPFDLTRWPPPPPKPPPTREPLWTMQRSDGAVFECNLLYHGEWGVEARILKRGELLIGRRFDSRALAVQWADDERRALESK